MDPVVASQTRPERTSRPYRSVPCLETSHRWTFIARGPHAREAPPTKLPRNVLDRDYNFYMDVQQGINLRIYERFEDEGIEFAFPTQTLFVNGPSGGARAESNRSAASTESEQSSHAAE